MKNRIPLRTGPLLWIVPCLVVGGLALFMYAVHATQVGDRLGMVVSFYGAIACGLLALLLPVVGALLNQAVYLGTIRALRHIEAERAQVAPTSSTSTP